MFITKRAWLRFLDTNYTNVLKCKRFFFSCSCHSCPKQKPTRHPVRVFLIPFDLWPTFRRNSFIKPPTRQNAAHKLKFSQQKESRKPKILKKFKVIKLLKLLKFKFFSLLPLVYNATQRLYLDHFCNYIKTGQVSLHH